MFTRKDYLDKKCTHREYYSQFVTVGVKNAVLREIGKENILDAFKTSEHFSKIPLKTWDTIADYQITSWEISSQMKKAGDYLTLGSAVCIAKEAALQIATSEK